MLLKYIKFNSKRKYFQSVKPLVLKRNINIHILFKVNDRKIMSWATFFCNLVQDLLSFIFSLWRILIYN